MNKTSLNTKFIMAGIVLLVVFNPLAVNLWVDALIIVIEQGSKLLVEISNYTMAVGGTLLAVGAILWNSERGKKETTKLKKLSKKKAEKAGAFLE